MQKFKAVIGILVIFASGAVSGWYLSLTQFEARLLQLQQIKPEEKQNLVVGAMAQNLGLNEEQKKIVGEAMRRAISENFRIREEARAQIGSNISQAVEKFLPVLNPEQRERVLHKLKNLQERNNWTPQKTAKDPQDGQAADEMQK